MTQQLKERIDKWDYMKLKTFYTTKKNGLQLEDSAHKMEENFCL
jgi:hypothetical protein